MLLQTLHSSWAKLNVAKISLLGTLCYFQTPHVGHEYIIDPKTYFVSQSWQEEA